METEVGQLRNLRDFLMVYNRMTEICFQRCSSNFNYRSLTLDEERCVDSCAGKLIRSNHRLMGTYVQLMPKMVQRRMDEMEAKAAENAKAAEAAAAGAPAPALGEELGGGGAAASVPPTAESSPAPQIPIITPSPSSETPALISPSVTDVGLVQLADATGQLAHMPEVSPPSSFVLGEATVAGPLLTSTPLDVSIELGPVGSASTTAVQPVTESKMAAATLLTPVMDTVNHSALTRENVTGPGVTAFLPLETPPNVTKLPPLLGGVQIESGSSVPPASVQPMLTLPTPVASPVSTIAVPVMSKPQEVTPAADK